ncbi:leucine--tRNA ligase [bacterium]|nr:leucine--tRNA ligase [bacterium]
MSTQTPDYDPATFEAAAQTYWREQKVFEVTEDSERPKFYCLTMFPYPSGKLHMGHVRNYTLGDVIARHKRMCGYNVLQPMGWDSFGLPAENAAIANRTPPAQWTYANIDHMRGQFESLGMAFDWSRELTTCKPDYYRWEQWFFTRLVDKGLAYKKNATVNWDPVDQTVLANEQVVDGRGWRSGAPVERREIAQWFIKTTDYAQEMLDALDTLDWPDAVKTMQRNWIGRSEGLSITFDVSGSDEQITVYTTRPDTLMGASYLAVAPEHPLVDAQLDSNPDLAKFVAECRSSTVSEAVLEAQDKAGCPLGLTVDHPLTGEPLPVWVANFVLMGYGTGAVMSVPAHDQRDWEFAGKYGLPIPQVITPADGAEVDISEGAYTERGLLINSGEFDRLDFDAAFAAIATKLEADGRAQRQVNFRLRDWGVSRQRYWGCPIPMIHDAEHGEVPAEEFPVTLPEELAPDGSGSPLKDYAPFVETTSPKTGEPAKRETDTFDTFFESSWYYARFCSPGNDQAMLDERAKYWLPVDQYIGGVEHATMHLMYARFFHKAMRDEGLVDCDEPFARYLPQGMVLGDCYFRDNAKGGKDYFAPDEVDITRDDKGRVVAATAKADGQPVVVGPQEKMSKSKRNGVDPQDAVAAVGADAVRLFAMFAAPPDQTLVWSDAGLEGASRFLKRYWRLVQAIVAGDLPGKELAAADVRRKLHETIAKVGDDMGRRQSFNTAVAALMELVNTLYKLDAADADAAAVARESLLAITQMLAPFSPHVTHAAWAALDGAGALEDAVWPEHDPALLVADTVEYMVQVNGKLRGRIAVPAEADKAAVEAAAVADENVLRHIDGKPLRRVIVVPGKLVNLVV